MYLRFLEPGGALVLPSRQEATSRLRAWTGAAFPVPDRARFSFPSRMMVSALALRPPDRTFLGKFLGQTL